MKYDCFSCFSVGEKTDMPRLARETFRIIAAVARLDGSPLYEVGNSTGHLAKILLLLALFRC